MFSRVTRSLARSSTSAVARPSLTRVLARSMGGASHGGHGDKHGHDHHHSGPPTSRFKSSEDMFPEGPSWAERDPSKIGTGQTWNQKLLSALDAHKRKWPYSYNDPRHQDYVNAIPDFDVDYAQRRRRLFEESGGFPLKAKLIAAAAVGGVVLIFAAYETQMNLPRAFMEPAPGKPGAAAAAGAGAGAGASSGLDEKNFVPLKLKAVKPYNHNTKEYIFELASPEAKLNLPTSSFFLVKSPQPGADGKDVIRPYTPIDQHIPGELRLLIKTYPTGALTPVLDALQPGASVPFKGPIKKLPYTSNVKKEVGMIAGGTGITPMLQVLDEALSDPQDHTKFTLVFANDTPRDILLKERLDAMAVQYPNRFRVRYVVSKPGGQDWKGDVGRVNEDIIKKWMPAPSKDSLVYVCGPPPMMKAISGDKVKSPTGAMEQGPVEGMLAKLSYTSDSVYKF